MHINAYQCLPCIAAQWRTIQTTMAEIEKRRHCMQCMPLAGRSIADPSMYWASPTVVSGQATSKCIWLTLTFSPWDTLSESVGYQCKFDVNLKKKRTRPSKFEVRSGSLSLSLGSAEILDWDPFLENLFRRANENPIKRRASLPGRQERIHLEPVIVECAKMDAALFG